MRELEPNIPISGLEDYHITKRGNLYSKKKGSWVRLKGELADGRRQYRLYNNGISRWYKASILVALVYVNNPNPNEYNVICHIDNDPTNNYYKNLYWGTQSMNIQQAVKENRFYQCKRYGKDNPAYGKPGPMRGKKGTDHPSYGKPSKMKGKHIREETKSKISNSIRGEKHPNFKCTREIVDRVTLLRNKGLTQTKIGSILKLHQTQVSKILNKQYAYIHSTNYTGSMGSD